MLTASIDLSGPTRSGPPLGWFLGTFDGKGHTIRNLHLQGDAAMGLFFFIWSGAEVKNLGLVDAEVRGSGPCGVLAPNNLGNVLNCYSTGVVSATKGMVGGLVGENEGTLANSYSSAQVSGASLVGGLAGSSGGAISSCYSTGSVAASGLMVGGLVGSNFGQITSSYSSATVTGQGPCVGGLVGDNSGTITASHAQAKVVGQAWSVGGLVGENNSRISECYTTGSVTGQEDVGGLVGYNHSLIASSYADVTAVSYDRYTGGLAGVNWGGISNCYSAGSVEGEDDVGGLVGENYGTIATSYSVTGVQGYGWYAGGLAGTSGSTAIDSYFLDNAGPDNGVGTPLTRAQMKVQASFVGWDFWGTAADGVDDTWFMPYGAYPVLAWQLDITGLRQIPNVAGYALDDARTALTAAGFVPGSVSYDFSRAVPAGDVIGTQPHSLAPAGAGISLVVSIGGAYNWTDNDGKGTPANPYQIQTAGQLESWTDHAELWDKCFVLAADVDMSGRLYTATLIAPDTDNSASGFQGTPFTGSFNGQGHAIRNLTIHTDSHHDYIGLFGMIDQGGRIDDLRLLDADVSGGTGSNTILGVLAGYNAGTITDCSATGVVRGGQGDGFVGSGSGPVINCHADIMRI